MTLGERIAKARSEKGMTLHDLSSMMHKTPQWLHNIEKGRRAIRAEDLNELAQCLGVDIGSFFSKELNGALNKVSRKRAKTA